MTALIQKDVVKLVIVYLDHCTNILLQFVDRKGHCLKGTKSFACKLNITLSIMAKPEHIKKPLILPLKVFNLHFVWHFFVYTLHPEAEDLCCTYNA